MRHDIIMGSAKSTRTSNPDIFAGCTKLYVLIGTYRNGKPHVSETITICRHPTPTQHACTVEKGFSQILIS